MNLEVILLDYPSHIATAVCFNENITGDYFDINGKKYVCEQCEHESIIRQIVLNEYLKE